MDSENSSAQSALLVGLLVMPVVVVVAVVLGVVGGILWLVSTSAPASTTSTLETPVVSTSAPSTMQLVVVNASGQLVTMAPDGNERHILTEGDYRFQFPAWSPNGRWIAAIAHNQAESAIFVLPPDGSEPTVVYQDSRDVPIYLSWSPDSAQVSFIANHPADGIALYLAPASGAADSQLVTTGQPFYWDWAGDSASLLVHTGFVGSDPRLAFWEVGQATAGEALAAPGYFQSPDLSPSGRYIAYATENGSDERQIAIVEQATGRRVDAPHQGLAALAWSPTADNLAYIASVGNVETFFGPLRLLDPATGAVRTLSADLVVAFFWSPDGRTLAYLTPHGAGSRSRDLWQPADPAIQPVALHPIQEERGVALDLWLVDVASGETRFNSTLTPSTLFLAQFLPFFDQYARSHRVWAPDSQSLVLPITSEGLAFIARFFTDGRSPDLVTLGFSAFWTWQ